MAHVTHLPCDGDGICMICKETPEEGEALTCKTCVTPWHVNCLSVKPETLEDTVQWECPDCSTVASGDPPPPMIGSSRGGGSESSGDLLAAIRAIESDQSLSEKERAKRRQVLMSGSSKSAGRDGADDEKGKGGNEVLNILDDSLNCSFCMQLPERPVTTPCGHNFCLKCFQKWVGQGKRTCANCRNTIPPKMASQPRINSALVIAIRMAKMLKSNASGGPPKSYHFVHNQNRPDKAYTTDRAKKSGKANACSGKIFVTVPPDHFGPILAENDPVRNLGVLVGEMWEDRMECRQWGAHLPHVAGISGQADYGAQSVALSGGYEDDEDHGEWFLYTGSGGRDLSGNKRTNKTQSFDQKFDKFNEALRVSCRKGYPVRVVRSHKEKRSSYAPETGVRYDGIYRIEKCWRKTGIQGFKVCRYLFVRCDNDPAPWTSDEHGDRPRPLPNVKELKDAVDITERKGTTSWDYDEEKGCWIWKNIPPPSRKKVDCETEGKVVRVKHQTKQLSVREKLLKEFGCLICQKVMILPLTTPCAHNFCKACLEGTFAGQSFIKQRTCEGRRTLRAHKNIMKCPSCANDISDFLKNPQVNRELMNVIESLQREIKEEKNGESGEDAVATDGNHEVSSIDCADKTNVDLEEETDGSDKSDVVRGKQSCDVDSEVLEGDDNLKEGTAKPFAERKPPLPSKRKKEISADNDLSVSEVNDKKELQSDDTCDEVKRSHKLRKADGEDSPVRGMHAGRDHTN